MEIDNSCRKCLYNMGDFCEAPKDRGCRKPLFLKTNMNILLRGREDTPHIHEWVVCGDGENVPYLCSHCGKTVPAILIEKYPHNYCPNCGAKMT